MRYHYCTAPGLYRTCCSWQLFAIFSHSSKFAPSARPLMRPLACDLPLHSATFLLILWFFAHFFMCLATFSPILWPFSLFTSRLSTFCSKMRSFCHSAPHLSTFSPKTCQFHASSSVSDAFSSRMRSFALSEARFSTCFRNMRPLHAYVGTCGRKKPEFSADSQNLQELKYNIPCSYMLKTVISS